MGTGVLSLGVERLGRETDHSSHLAGAERCLHSPNMSSCGIHGDDITSYGPWFDHVEQYKRIVQVIWLAIMHIYLPFAALSFTDSDVSS